MSDLTLNRFVFLDSHGVSDRELWLRFVPDGFRLESDTPVLRIEIQEVVEPKLLDQKIEKISDVTVDVIEVVGAKVSVWPEMVDSPVEFQGTVIWKYEDYGINDFSRALKERDAEIESLGSEIRGLNKTISVALRFIDRTIDHIERKQELTGADEARFSDQIRLLRGVRRHFRDDEQSSI